MGKLSRKLKLAILFWLLSFILFMSSVSYAQKKPQPFGLKLGISTKEETLEIIKKEGGKITENGYKVIKGDITNPNVEGIEVKGLPVDNLSHATFWFFKGKLYMIVYHFPLSMNKEEFYVLSDQLKKTYGQPKRYVRPWLANGLAVWDFGDVRITLSAPWASWTMYLTYEHIPLAKEVEKSDAEVYHRETAKPKKGL
jgi:hypothetical protein